MEKLLEEAAEGDDVDAWLLIVEDKGSHPSRVPVVVKTASYFVIAAKISSAGDVGISHGFGISLSILAALSSKEADDWSRRVDPALIENDRAVSSLGTSRI